MGMEMTMKEWPIPVASSTARSRLAEDLEVDGDVSSTGPIDIMGKINGTVQAPDVLVAATGRIAVKSLR